jgi:hypothetical protein
MVLALPEFGTEITNREEETGKRHGRAQIEATRNGARPCPFTRLLPTAGQNYENG